MINVFNKKDKNITFAELPGHISLVYMLPGCGRSCTGCHTPELRNRNNGDTFSIEELISDLNYYDGKISAVVWLGGEWFQDFPMYLKEVSSRGVLNCLYTAESSVKDTVLQHLDFVKYGEWNASLGGLDSKTTNQTFIEVKTNKNMNHLFHRRDTTW